MKNLTPFKKCEGKEIASVEVIQDRMGRTWNYITCITFTDGTRSIIGGTCVENIPHPNPRLEQMQKAPKFFSAEEIAETVLQEEKEARRKKVQEDDRKRREAQRLLREIGDID